MDVYQQRVAVSCIYFFLRIDFKIDFCRFMINKNMTEQSKMGV